MSAGCTVTLREEWDSPGPTVADLVEFGAKATALGLTGYNVRAVLRPPPGGNGRTVLAVDTDEPRYILVLTVTGQAPDLR